MHIEVVAVWTPTHLRTENRSHRISIEIRVDPRFCSFQADFQPVSSRIVLAPWSDRTRLPSGLLRCS